MRREPTVIETILIASLGVVLLFWLFVLGWRIVTTI